MHDAKNIEEIAKKTSGTDGYSNVSEIEKDERSDVPKTKHVSLTSKTDVNVLPDKTLDDHGQPKVQSLGEKDFLPPTHQGKSVEICTETNSVVSCAPLHSATLTDTHFALPMTQEGGISIVKGQTIDELADTLPIPDEQILKEDLGSSDAACPSVPGDNETQESGQDHCKEVSLAASEGEDIPCQDKEADSQEILDGITPGVGHTHDNQQINTTHDEDTPENHPEAAYGAYSPETNNAPLSDPLCQEPSDNAHQKEMHDIYSDAQENLVTDALKTEGDFKEGSDAAVVNEAQTSEAVSTLESEESAVLCDDSPLQTPPGEILNESSTLTSSIEKVSTGESQSVASTTVGPKVSSLLKSPTHTTKKVSPVSESPLKSSLGKTLTATPSKTSTQVSTTAKLSPTKASKPLTSPSKSVPPSKTSVGVTKTISVSRVKSVTSPTASSTVKGRLSTPVKTSSVKTVPTSAQPKLSPSKSLKTDADTKVKSSSASKEEKKSPSDEEAVSTAKTLQSNNLGDPMQTSEAEKGSVPNTIETKPDPTTVPTDIESKEEIQPAETVAT